MSQYLFAYGTLQPGLAPTKIARMAAKLRPVGEGFVRGLLYDLGGYPGAVPDANAEGRIRGTILQLPEDPGILVQLDDYEGFDPQAPEQSEFVRERLLVERPAGRGIECWIYRYNWKTDTLRAIADGEWSSARES